MKYLIFLFTLTLCACQVTPEKSWELVWSDEFDAAELNPDNWSYALGDGCPNLCGWGNNELQFYTEENTSIRDGKLVITAKHDSLGGKAYTSSRILSKGKQEFQYGRMELRAKIPGGKGTWPALWMLGSNISEVSWPQCGEIDIMEHITRMPDIIHGTVHAPATRGGNSKNSGGLKVSTATKDFHLYAIEWDQNAIRFFIDDLNYFTYQPEVKTKENWPFDQPFYFLMNIAVGGNWPGFDIDDAAFPQTMEVDYVRVYQ